MDWTKQIQSHRLFTNVDSDMLQKQSENHFITVCDFRAGETIYYPGNTERRMGFLLSGTASVFSADENNSVLLRVLETGDTFGVSNLFSTNQAFVSLIVAKKASKVLFFSQQAVLELLREDESFCMNYIHFLSDRICFLNQKISCFTAGSPERKLAFFLLSCESEEIEQYSLTINANSLSDMLNIGRASLYRALDALIEDGIIRKVGKTITVLDKNALKIRLG